MVKVTIEESAVRKDIDVNKSEKRTAYSSTKVTEDCVRSGRGKDKSEIASGSAASLYHYLQGRKRTAEEDLTVFPGYSSKTLTSNWFVPITSYPKDYDAANTPLGNYHRSTYKRLGDSEGEMLSETHSAMKNCIAEKKKPALKKNPPLFNLVTLSAVNMEDFLTEDSELLTGKPRKYSDMYTTTMQNDFINYFPQTPKFVDRAPLYKPETKHRNLLTELSHPRRPGRNKFFDENVEYLNKRRKEPISLPPWALHYDPRKCKEEEEGQDKKHVKTNITSDKMCENCT